MRGDGPVPDIRSPQRAACAVDREAGWVLRGSLGYPERLSLRMGEEAPGAVWLAGDPARAGSPQIAFVGSRRAAPGLLASAGRLAHRLAEAGWVVSSGCAQGADTAALEGGLKGAAGVLGIPACGFSALPAALSPGSRPGLSLLAVAPPWHPFNAGYALRRNDVIGAMADALVLVAAGPKSGSWYSVRRALSAGTPVFCLECGSRTPQGNAWLLRQGLAVPIMAGAPPEAGAAAIVAAARGRQATRPWMAANQPDFLENLAGRGA